MPRRPAPLPDSLGEVFRTRAGLERGVSRARLGASDLHAPFHGVRVRSGPAPADDPDDPFARGRRAREREWRRARAYAPLLTASAFFTGRTAAILYGLPLDPGDDLDVGVIAPARAPRGRGVRGVKVEGHLVRVRECEGLPLGSPASTWAMLGRELSVRELVVLGDAIVRIPRGRSGIPHPDARLATRAQLASAVDAGPRRGIARLRSALPLIREGSMSPLETLFRLDAADAGLPPAELDVEMRDASGRLLGISEFVYRTHRVVVEIEGDHHRTSRAQWNRDLEKYAAYAAAGWEVVRVTSSHLRQGRAVELVRAALERHR